METKVLRRPFELSELRNAACSGVETTVSDTAPERPMQRGWVEQGVRPAKASSLLPMPGGDVKSEFHKDAAFFISEVPLQRVRRRSGARGIGDRVSVDVRRGCVFTHQCFFEVKDQEAAGKLPRGLGRAPASYVG